MAHENCIFCRIVAGEIPSYKVFEDESFFAFLDQSQAKDGHTLVIPKAHHENIFETPDELLGQLAVKVKEVASIVKTKVEADGITLLQCNGAAGLQSVFHIHFHVIPGWDNDRLNEPWESRVCDSAYLTSVHSRFN